MRIVLSNSSWKWGGVHTVTAALARGLAERGHDVALLCRPGSELEAEMRGVVPLVPILRGADFNPLAVLRAVRALRELRAQIVLALMDKDLRLTGVAARVLRVPVVVRRANDQPLRSAHSRLFYARIASRVVANSDATRRTLLAAAPALSRRGVHVIRNGIDVAAFAGAHPADLGLADDAVAFGFVGRFEARKGLRELIAAWPTVSDALPRAVLVLAGRGALEPEVDAWAATAERVHRLGYRRDVAALMHALDILVMPSHWEGFGLVAAEAMAAGTPVVASDVSSLPEVVRDGVSGLLVPPRDANALARAMIEVGRDDGLRQRLGSAGRRIAAEEFSNERMVEEWEALLRDSLA